MQPSPQINICSEIIQDLKDYSEQRVNRLLFKLKQSYYYYAFFVCWVNRYGESFKDMHEPFVVFDILSKIPIKIHYGKIKLFLDFLEEEMIIEVTKGFNDKILLSKNKHKTKTCIILIDDKIIKQVVNHPQLKKIRDHHKKKNAEKQIKEQETENVEL